MKNALFFLLVALLPGIASATTVKMSLSEAINNNTVKTDGVNFTGGYHGKTTRIMITNNTASVLQITVDPGVIFKADSNVYQPMVLAGDEFVVIQPNGQGQVEVETFCGDGPKHCPQKDLHYTFSRVGSDTLVKLLQYLKKNPAMRYWAQDAVWIVTNFEDIGSIYDSDSPDEAAKLRDFLCSITGRPKPAYYTQTAKTPAVPDQPAYVPKTMKIIADFQIDLDAQKTLTLGVYNDSGVMVQKVFENQVFGKPDRKTGQRFGVEFEAEGALKGYYYIRLKEGEVVLKETKVKVN